MRYLKRNLFVIIVCLLVQVSAYASVYDDGDEYDDPPKIKTPVYAIDDEVDLVSTKKLEYGKPRIVVKSVYPKLESSVEDDEQDESIFYFNRLINDIIQDTIAEYTNMVVEKQSIQKQIPHSTIKNSLFTDYDTSVIKVKNHRIISLRFTIQGTIAGARHAYRTHKTLNYNLDDNQIIELTDLFIPGTNYLQILSDYTRRQLRKHLSDTTKIAYGTTPTSHNFKNWNIKSDGLLITFDENQVAPRIAGTQTVFVPFSILKGVTASDSPIFDCIKNKRRCARTNILTGGFIDAKRKSNKNSLLEDYFSIKANL